MIETMYVCDFCGIKHEDGEKLGTIKLVAPKSFDRVKDEYHVCSKCYMEIVANIEKTKRN